VNNIAYLLTQHGGGSTMLCNMLDNHPQIHCKHEAAYNFQDKESYLEHFDTDHDLVILHFHYTHIRDWSIFKDHPVLMLERLDNVCGAIKTSMFGLKRAPGWEFPVECIKPNADLRYERYREMEKVADKVIILEDIAPTFIDTLEDKDSRDICEFYGVEVEPLMCTATKNREDENLPINMDELYASASS
jgi:hypothetical protein